MRWLIGHPAAVALYWCSKLVRWVSPDTLFRAHNSLLVQSYVVDRWAGKPWLWEY